MADFDPVSHIMGAKAGSGGGGGGASTLSGLTDVDISNPTDGQTLVYNATSGKWENGAGGGGGSTLAVHETEVDEDFVLDHTYAEIAAAAPFVALDIVNNSMHTIKWLVAYGAGTGENLQYAVGFSNGNTEDMYVTDNENGYPVYQSGQNPPA